MAAEGHKVVGAAATKTGAIHNEAPERQFLSFGGFVFVLKLLLLKSGI